MKVLESMAKNIHFKVEDLAMDTISSERNEKIETVTFREGSWKKKGGKNGWRIILKGLLDY